MCNCGQNGNATDQSYGCVDCDVGPFTRNNYFMGKLLVERDFKDEQAYYVDKALLHNRQLHGCGVVCGLRVTEHEAENCRPRYVCIEPGTAIDCCGHEIIVPEKECVDITQIEAVKNLIFEVDANQRPLTHRLQICLRYRECPTEEIPVLYDDCGCDDTGCAPNRILESYDVDVLVDEPDEPKALLSPHFERSFTIPLGEAIAVALDEAGGSLYVLAGAPGGTISRVSLADGTISPQSRTLPAGRTCQGITLSEDGTRLYAALEPATAGNPVQVLVIDTADLAGALVRTVDVPDSANSSTDMATAGGRLLTLARASGKLHVWGTALDSAPASGDPPLTPEAPVNLGVTNVSGLAVSSDGKSAFTLDPSPTTHRVLVADLSTTPPQKGADITVLPPIGASPRTLAVVATTGPDRLAVATAEGNLHLLAASPPELLGTATNLAHKAVALAVSPGGQWAYVIETDGTTGESFIQAVNIYKLGLKQNATPGAPFPIGPQARGAAITSAGERLYIPYMGTPGPPPVAGGVALIDITEQDCEEILWRHLRGCPGCEGVPCTCVVLATIENYVPGFAMRDVETPPTKPEDDLAQNIARIDNRNGRRLLPSTQTLLELIQCAIDKGPGGAGKQGPPGEPGPGIDQVEVTTVPCGQNPAPPRIENRPAGRTLVLELPSELDDLDVEFETVNCGADPNGEIMCEPNDPDKRKLVLRLPPGLKDLQVEIREIECGAPPKGRIEEDRQNPRRCKLVLEIPTGCNELDLPHIVAINWPHDAILQAFDQGRSQKVIEGFFKNGLIIAFDAEMLPQTVNRHTVQVLFNRANPDGQGDCFCNLRGRVTPVRVQTNSDQEGRGIPKCGDEILGSRNLAGGEMATGARFFPENWDWNQDVEYQVIAKGDFILAAKEDPQLKLMDGKPGHRALDGDHLGPGLPHPPVFQTIPPLPARCPTGDGVEGGTFESWFSIFRERPNFMRLNVNEATPEELLAVRGVGPALLERIESARRTRPFTDLEDFRRRVRLTERELERISPEIRVVERDA
ncbi:MAG TPA: helix-hairpin-helix domain-containing protein [Chloroflexia bacterium]|nr:helix-hairpin-helix domain-containing protein [Chloroflexia bacterium]